MSARVEHIDFMEEDEEPIYRFAKNQLQDRGLAHWNPVVRLIERYHHGDVPWLVAHGFAKEIDGQPGFYESVDSAK